MSATISGSSGLMPTLLRNVDQLSAQNNQLTEQISTGLVSTDYAGLGADAYQAISLDPQISQLGAWQTNITQAQVKLSATQSAMTGINSIATSLQTSLLTLQSSSSAGTIATMSQQALQQLTQLTSLLNTSTGSSYVFAGTASDQAPVPSSDLASSSVVSGIISAVAQVGTNGAAATESTTLSIASGASAAGSIFSSQLSVSPASAATLVPQVQIGSGDMLASGLVASQGTAASASSTGSPIADLIRGLATVAGLSQAGPSSAGYQTLVSDTLTQVGSAVQGLQTMTSQVGAMQDQATSQSSLLSDTTDALQSQLTNITGSDLATVRTQQVAVQNQLTASYTLISDMRTMNLAQYL